MKLAGKYKEVRRIVEALRAWAEAPAGDAPPVVLNKHCPSCPFRDACLQQAEKEDNLSLLDRMTPKLMRKYHDKGIFTVKQLSHIYKPRRSRKKAKRQVRHSLELQALAIRTGKVHVEHLPELPRGPVELFLDIEGVPDRDFHYLAGLLVCRGGEAEYESFWADDAAGEAAMWSALVERLEAFPDSPVYHYGSYEKKAFATLAKRHGRGGGLERPPRQRGVVRLRQGLLPGPVERAEAAGPIPGGGVDRPAGVGPAKPGLAAQVGDDAGRAVQAVPAPVQPRGLRGRPAAGRSPGPDQAGRGVGPDRSSLPAGRSGTRPKPGRRSTGSSSGS